MATRRSQLDLDAMQPMHLKCRTLGHSWDDYDADESDPKVVVQILRCLRCESLKKIKIIRVGRFKGFLDGSAYMKYAEGYQFKNAGRPLNTSSDRAKMRLYRYQQQALTHAQ